MKIDVLGGATRGLREVTKTQDDKFKWIERVTQDNSNRGYSPEGFLLRGLEWI